MLSAIAFPSRAAALANFASKAPFETFRADVLHCYVQHGLKELAGDPAACVTPSAICGDRGSYRSCNAPDLERHELPNIRQFVLKQAWASAVVWETRRWWLTISPSAPLPCQHKTSHISPAITLSPRPFPIPVACEDVSGLVHSCSWVCRWYRAAEMLP